MIVSQLHFMYFATFASLLICAIWGAREVYLLVKYLPRRGREQWKDSRQWRDQIFGSVIGVVVLVIGIIGVIRFWTRY
jgi:sterol desaturase/sphingolipid hydroxylase (fatty acid hydroxylase superfamily)